MKLYSDFLKTYDCVEEQFLLLRVLTSSTLFLCTCGEGRQRDCVLGISTDCNGNWGKERREIEKRELGEIEEREGLT